MEVAGAFGYLESDTLFQLLLLETVWMAAETKLPFSATQGPSHFLCQATTLTHRPFCLEHPELCAQQRASLEEKGEVRRREVWKKKKWEAAFVKGLTIVSPCCPHHLPSSCCSVLPVDVTPGLFPANMLQCSATPHLQRHYSPRGSDRGRRAGKEGRTQPFSPSPLQPTISAQKSTTVQSAVCTCPK